MKLQAFFLASLLSFVATAHAQNVDSLAGQWSGSTKSPNSGEDLFIQVSISDSQSTWKYLTQGSARRGNACLNRDFPLVIKTVDTNKLMFSVDGFGMIAGCPSFSVALERSEDQTLSGKFGDGRPLTLKKK